MLIVTYVTCTGYFKTSKSSRSLLTLKHLAVWPIRDPNIIFASYLVFKERCEAERCFYKNFAPQVNPFPNIFRKISRKIPKHPFWNQLTSYFAERNIKKRRFCTASKHLVVRTSFKTPRRFRLKKAKRDEFRTVGTDF